MDFNPCVKHRIVRRSVREFAEKELAPIAQVTDRNAEFPVEAVDKMKALGYFGLLVPSAYGGSSMDTVSFAVTIEELSRVCAAVGLCISVHNSVCVIPLVQFGTDKQKEKYLPSLAAGKDVGAFCITEANAGSDASSVETYATRTEGGYLINGTKIFVTNGGICTLPLIFAVSRTPPGKACVFILERGSFIVGEIEDLCGMRANPVSSIFLEDAFVPFENLLGDEGSGLKIGLAALDAGRIGIAAQALGIAQAAFEASVKYSIQRRQFNKTLSSFQTIQNYLADMATDIDAARLLVYRAGDLRDSNRSFSAEAAMAKLFSSSLASRVTSKAVQIHGGYGYSKEYDVERYFRDAKVTEIYEGTSEVQRTVISRYVLNGHSTGVR